MRQRLLASVPTAFAAALMLPVLVALIGITAHAPSAHAATIHAVTTHAATARTAPLSESPARTDVNDFEFDSFDAEFTLGRDEEGRSTLHTREHLVAVFPDFDQNRGFIRDLPRFYDGHETHLRVIGVTDETGAPRPYTTEHYGDFLSVIMAVPEGSFVHGTQHYVIEYEQRDVTRYFADTRADEFYWDVNGTDWAQPFGRVSARITLEHGLASQLNGDASCYRGRFGSSDGCELRAEDRGFAVDEHDLWPGENVTFAIGFEPGTFAGPPETPAQFLHRVPLLLWSAIAAFAATIAAFIAALLGNRGARTGRAIIAQYDPPQGVSVALASEMLRTRGKTMTATLLDFAVRRKLRLLHHDPSDQYGAQAIDNSGLLPIEARAYARIFTGYSGGNSAISPGLVAPGTTHWFLRTDTRLGDAGAALRNEAKQEARTLGLVKKAGGGWIAAIIALPILGLALLVLHAVIIGDFVMMTVALAVGINLLIWGLLGMVAAVALRTRNTLQGALLLDQLEGLKLFIRVAEADRILMLQSASGAEVSEDLIVQVYERLLPYAVLFGFEKEWQGELARYYRESTPEWVVGQGSFAHALPIVAFASSVSRSPTTQSVSSGGSGSGGSFSSFSGGSSGGGFSGGGGGGGGGRGI